MHRHPRRTFVYAEPVRHRRVINRATLGHETIFERLEVIGFSCRHEFLAQPVHRQLKQRNRPLLVEGIFGRDEPAQRKLDEQTSALIARLRVSLEGQEGLSAFLEKRPPTYTDR